MFSNGGGIFGIASMLGGIALISFLVANAEKTATVVNSVGKTFAGNIRVATLQSDYGNLFSM